MKEKLIKIIFPVIFVLLCLGGCRTGSQVITDNEKTSYSDKKQITDSEITETVKTEEVYVYITGKVKNPDVYKVPEDYRIYQVIELAGGFLDDAETRNINLADRIYDGMQITVYAVGEETVYGCVANTNTGSSLININTASKEELMTLPGIGDAKAESIIRYRNENGYFSSIEDIMNISGIKEGAFEKIKDYITV